MTRTSAAKKPRTPKAEPQETQVTDAEAAAESRDVGKNAWAVVTEVEASVRKGELDRLHPVAIFTEHLRTALESDPVEGDATPNERDPLAHFSFDTGALADDVRKAVLDEFRLVPKPWQQMAEWEQERLNARAHDISRKLVGGAIKVVMGRGADVIPLTIKGINLEKEIKIKLVLSDPEGTLGVKLAQFGLNPAMMVLSSPAEFTEKATPFDPDNIGTLAMPRARADEAPLSEVGRGQGEAAAPAEAQPYTGEIDRNLVEWATAHGHTARLTFEHEDAVTIAVTTCTCGGFEHRQAWTPGDAVAAAERDRAIAAHWTAQYDAAQPAAPCGGAVGSTLEPAPAERKTFAEAIREPGMALAPQDGAA